jgi:hypothetical protein
VMQGIVSYKVLLNNCDLLLPKIQNTVSIAPLILPLKIRPIAAYQSPMAHEGATKGSKSKYLSCEIRNILHNTTFERCVTFNP